MPDVKSWFRGLRKIWLVGLVIALALLWAAEGAFLNGHPAWQLFVREVAFALLISCVFGLTIEQIQRGEFIRLVTEEREVLKRDVFLYAYGHNLPEQIRAEIRNSVLHQSFYRHDPTIDWEFSPPKDTGLMLVRKRYSYTVVNNSNETKSWPFSFIQIGADDREAVADSTLSVLRVKHRDVTKEYRAADMIEERPSDQPHMRKISTSIEIGAQESMQVYYESIQMRKLYGEDRYNSKESVVGTTKIKLRFPSDPGFEVTVNCKTKPLQLAADNEPPTLYSFEYNEGIFPYQGITISWSTKEDLPDQGSRRPRQTDPLEDTES